MFLFTLCAVLLSLYCVYWWFWSDVWIHGERIPGPRWLPFIGNLHMSSSDNVVNFKTAMKMFSEYGPMFRIWLGPVHLMVTSSDPEVVRQVMTHPLVTDRDYMMTKVISTFASRGIVATNGDEWRRHRKIMSPAFHRQMLQQYVGTFTQKARVLVDTLREVADGRTLDIYSYLGMSTFDAISETLIGVECNTLQNCNDFYLKSMQRVNDILVQRCAKPYLLLDWLFHRTSLGKEAVIISESLGALSAAAIQDKLSSYRRGVRREGVVTAGSKTLNSFLDMMVAASEVDASPLTAAELEDEVLTLLFVGTDSTALAMAYFLILVAIHGDVQEQIREELTAVFADNRRPLTEEDLNNMPVLDRALKESLRLYPTAPASPRFIPENIILSNGNVIPKGSSFVLFSYAMHRSEANFKDADRFWPDRWLTENRPEDLHPFAYAPFSAGPRGCIGHRFAMMMMKCTLSEVLRKYHVTTRLSERFMIDNLALGLATQMDERAGGYQIQLQRRLS